MRIRIVDLITWVGMGIIAWLLILSLVGCGFLENLDTVAEVARDAQEQGAVIQEQVEDEDWFGLTESILVGAGALVSAFGAKKGYDKLKGTGDGTKKNS